MKADEVWHNDSALRDSRRRRRNRGRSWPVSPVTRTRRVSIRSGSWTTSSRSRSIGDGRGADAGRLFSARLRRGHHASASQLGTLVTGVTYRHPGLLVKTVTTLDVLSGGRAWLGIGAGWYEREHLGLGVPFPPVSERFERLEETLQIAQQMWSGEVGPYEGKHYQLAETLCQPMPLSTPHPRIMIGGGGEQKTLRLVARYADACNLFAMPGEEGLATLSAQARRPARSLRGRRTGRSRPSRRRSSARLRCALSTPRAMSPDAMPAFLEQLEGIGIDHYIVPIVDPRQPGLSAERGLGAIRPDGGVVTAATQPRSV